MDDPGRHASRVSDGEYRGSEPAGHLLPPRPSSASAERDVKVVASAGVVGTQGHSSRFCSVLLDRERRAEGFTVTASVYSTLRVKPDVVISMEGGS